MDFKVPHPEFEWTIFHVLQAVGINTLYMRYYKVYVEVMMFQSNMISCNHLKDEMMHINIYKYHVMTVHKYQYYNFKSLFREILESQNLEESFRDVPQTPCTCNTHNLIHYQHPTPQKCIPNQGIDTGTALCTKVYSLHLGSSCHIFIDKFIVVCINPYNIMQNNFTVLKFL